MKLKCNNLRLFLALAIVTGLVYPLLVTGLALALFPREARGSMLQAKDGRLVGSELVAQPVTGENYFWPRPSAADYATLPSGASNLSWSSAELKKIVEERREFLWKSHGFPSGTPVPSDLLFASGSGLDPHISPAAAEFQVERVAKARRLSSCKVRELIRQNTVSGGFLGEDGVNVLMLNLALDALN
ncbi:potassium-transporting ATPase subunit KdpC [Akkermansia sp. N21116]|jgi:K+-transporting ATPase ATPase C chain|uniref:potassium-transporting ATPase subunit KdpC n=1 Tax=Akkermansia sp. N21116 TaxID=3040764 RepID=UPI00244F01F3|nr:potassium-transporting ATPase subunit KdpC [Akkermansia sp. N21116]WPX40779.1 potassium-transporting ATPase subunit KdpC [Akkermansia sp. N21116]